MSKDEIKPVHDSGKPILVGSGIAKTLGEILSHRIEPKKDVVVIDDNTFSFSRPLPRNGIRNVS